MPLLLTKLFMPEITQKHIKREKLLQKLISGYAAGNQLTLVCAPAGYGKTTAVLEFLHAVDADSAWISLDEGDNDAQRFLAYLVAAFRKAQVPIGNDIDTLLTDIGLKTTETVLTMLVNGIADCTGRKILVLDDYHVIRSQPVHDLLKFLLDYQPPNLHLIIVSREDPQLPLSRLRMKDRLTELRADDLLFTREEVAELFDKATEIKLGSEAVQRLTHRTEGWIAGLQLAALLLKSIRQDQVDDFIRKFDGTNSYIIDYMVEEVLERQPQEIRDFLCRTSVLERMNDRLCNELTGRCDSREVLQRIDKANLFLIPLDDKREWYRYHHLFADSLKIRLSEADEREMNRKAAVWMKNNGFSDEAVRYAFKSKELDLAMKMVEDTTLEAFQNAQLESLVKWLALLPEDMIKRSEVLSVRKAIACFITGRVDEGIQYMNSLDDDFEQKASPHNKGLLYYLKAVTAGLMGQDSEPFAREALKYLQPWDPIARTSALNNLGRAQYMKGQASDALVTLKSAYEEGLKLGYQFVTVLALMNYSACLDATGQSTEALSLCEQYIAQMKSRFDKLPPFAGILYVTMAGFYNSSDHTEKARLLKEEGLELCRSISYDVEGSLKVFKKAAAFREAKEATGMINYVEKLSERELEILTLLSKGLSNREIAETLFITINTTQWHISHIYDKLGAKSRTQAILKAKDLGILK